MIVLVKPWWVVTALVLFGFVMLLGILIDDQPRGRDR